GVVDEVTGVINEVARVLGQLLAGQVAHERQVIERVTEAVDVVGNGAGRVPGVRRQGGNGAGRTEREAHGSDNGTPLRLLGQGSPSFFTTGHHAGCSGPWAR